MITEDAGEFFVNGHQCLVRCKGRAHWVGLIGGEQIVSSHNASHVRSELIDQAKYQVEVEPDFWKVCRAVHNFLQRQTTRDDEYIWTYRDTVINKVTPLNDVGPAYRALLELESLGLVEKGQIAMDLNVEEMFRATEADTDYSEIPDDPWAEYRSG